MHYLCTPLGPSSRSTISEHNMAEGGRPKTNLVPRAVSSTIFKMADLPTIRHFENRRGEGPGDEVDQRCKTPTQVLHGLNRSYGANKANSSDLWIIFASE